MTNDKALENLRAALKKARQTAFRPPTEEETEAFFNLQQALKVARQALLSDEAYKAAEQKEWARKQDIAARRIAKAVRLIK